jgi:hypothetical protein
LYRSDQSSGSALLRHGQAFLSRSGALGCRATGVIEKLGPLLTLTPAVSFGRVQKHRETCTVKLLDQLPSMLGRPIRGIIQKRCRQGDESKFIAIDVVKKGIQLKNKTNYELVC